MRVAIVILGIITVWVTTDIYTVHFLKFVKFEIDKLINFGEKSMICRKVYKQSIDFEDSYQI